MESDIRGLKDETNAAESSGGRKWERSSIEFPYSDIGRAEGLVRALYDRGGGTAEPAQLAAWMDQTVKSGTFRSCFSAARLFGFVESDRELVRITEAGRDIVDPEHADRARAQAFLRVPLFNEMFRIHSGHVLPQATAIERQMVELGVPPKQKARARQVFQKSASLANYVTETGRLVKPAVMNTPTEAKDTGVSEDVDSGEDGAEIRRNSPYHPFIEGLLRELPDTKGFCKWTIEEQAEWLRAAASIFKLLSKTGGRIDITTSPKVQAPADRSRPGPAI